MGDPDGAMAASWQALDLAVALGDRALQAEASLYLGHVHEAIGDFGRATELLRQNVEATHQGSLIHPQNKRPDPLPVPGAPRSGPWARWGTSPRAGATRRRPCVSPQLEGRGATPIVVNAFVSRLYLVQGALEPAIRVLHPGPHPVACLREPGTCCHTSFRPWAMPLRSRGATRKAARCWRRRSAKVSQPPARVVRSFWVDGAARAVVWRDTVQKP